MTTEDRLAELEIAFAHHEATVEQLNQALIGQQAVIDALSLEVQQLRDRVRAITPSNIASEAEETPPPHY
ncbi:MAG: SlyX family protein [Chromatiales bacterium]|nr:SlyX family protein [Chromatiales bacterium]